MVFDSDPLRDYPAYPKIIDLVGIVLLQIRHLI